MIVFVCIGEKSFVLFVGLFDGFVNFFCGLQIDYFFGIDKNFRIEIIVYIWCDYVQFVFWCQFDECRNYKLGYMGILICCVEGIMIFSLIVFIDGCLWFYGIGNEMIVCDFQFGDMISF